MLETETERVERKTVMDNNLENTGESTPAKSVRETNFNSVVTFDSFSKLDRKLKTQPSA